MLTATAVMRLVADGKLDLHTPVAAYNRGLPYADDITALMYRDLGYTVIVLSNYDRPAARRVVNGIAAMLIA
jgi:hypothetical protein